MISFTSNTSGGLNCMTVEWQQKGPNDADFVTVAVANIYATESNLPAGDYEYRAIYSC